MLNLLWAGMIGAGVLYSAFTGRMADISNVALDSSKEGITLCITMLGVMAFWCGFMQIAEDAGLIKSMCRKMSPVVHWLFPRVPREHPASHHITTNIVANILGLGWAATPAGLRAMEELSHLAVEQNGKKGVASNEMCDFLILNISSLQLIPVNVIAYRSQYGSVNPASIVGAGILATSISTMIGILFFKIMSRKR